MSVTAYEQDYASDLERPIYPRPAGVVAALGIGAGALVVLAGFALFSGKPSEPQTAAAGAAANSAPVADPIAFAARTGAVPGVKPLGGFDLAPAEFASLHKTVAARKLEGDGREDNFTFGQYGGAEPYLRLDVTTPGAAKAGAPDFYLDLTRHAREAGLPVVKIGKPSPLQTRFGAFEAADMRLGKAGEGGADRTCLAVRLVGGKAPLEIAGVGCGAAGKPFDRATMSCVLDRLDYVSNGANKALEAFFLDAELARGQGCVAAAPGGDKAAWIEAHSGDAKGDVKSPAKVKKAKGAH